MYKLIYVLLIAFSGCLSGTQTAVEPSGDTRPIVSAQGSNILDSVISLDNEQVTNHQNLVLRLVDIEDSRCPTGVTCIWAGQLVVTLEVSNEFEEKIMVKLVRKRESEVAYAFGHRLLLLDVAPHPKKDKVIRLNEQTVQLELEKVK
jgi:hypothetical protein